MKVNVYGEELAEGIGVTIISKAINGMLYNGLRFTLPGEDNAITFWYRPNQYHSLRGVLAVALEGVDDTRVRASTESTIGTDEAVEEETRL